MVFRFDTLNYIIALGGWEGSHWFTNATSTYDNCVTFANSLAGAVYTFGLDGMRLSYTGRDHAHVLTSAFIQELTSIG